MSQLRRESGPAALLAHLRRALGDLPEEALAALAEDATPRFLEGGRWLFREDDEADAAYVILNGRLRAERVDSVGRVVLQEMGAGETVGEMALLSPGRRAASVRAVRDTQLAVLSPQTFYRVTEYHPEVLRRMAILLVERLRVQGSHDARSAPPRTIAVCAAGPGAPVSAVARGAEQALRSFGRVRRLDASTLVSAGHPCDAELRSEAGMRLAGWLADREIEQDFLVYESDPDGSAWTRCCLRQADHVVWVTPESGGETPLLRAVMDSGELAAEGSLAWTGESPGSLGGAAGEKSEATTALRFGLALRREEDYARLARLLTGRAVGLVLGGGGARGFAHIGVIRVLEELGIPVDAVGGTSAGAVVGALAARGIAAEEIHRICREHFRAVFDPTLPTVALLRGRRLASRLAAVVGRGDIERLPLPFFSVSTNLSRGSLRVQRDGPIVRAVRASMSLPGVLPPVVESGELLVDGALLDNLPILAMRELTGGGPIVAVDVGGGFSTEPYAELPEHISGWSALGQRVRASEPVPSIFEILMRSAMVSSQAAASSTLAHPDLDILLQLPVHDLGMFAFDRIDEIVERGHRGAVDALQKWWEGTRSLVEGPGAAPLV